MSTPAFALKALNPKLFGAFLKEISKESSELLVLELEGDAITSLGSLSSGQFTLLGIF